MRIPNRKKIKLATMIPVKILLSLEIQHQIISRRKTNMKKSVKLFSILMVMMGSIAFGQTKVQEDLKQAGMQSLVEVSKTMYDEKQDVFILNIEKNDGTTLTAYERTLMMEVHNNIKAGNQFGKYETKILSQHSSYDRQEDCAQETAAKLNKKKIIKIIKVIVRILDEICDWIC